MLVYQRVCWFPGGFFQGTGTGIGIDLLGDQCIGTAGFAGRSKREDAKGTSTNRKHHCCEAPGIFSCFLLKKNRLVFFGRKFTIWGWTFLESNDIVDIRQKRTTCDVWDPIETLDIQPMSTGEPPWFLNHQQYGSKLFGPPKKDLSILTVNTWFWSMGRPWPYDLLLCCERYMSREKPAYLPLYWLITYVNVIFNLHITGQTTKVFSLLIGQWIVDGSWRSNVPPKREPHHKILRVQGGLRRECSREPRKKSGCLGHVGNYTTQIYIGIQKKHFKDPYETTSITESRSFFFFRGSRIFNEMFSLLGPLAFCFS